MKRNQDWLAYGAKYGDRFIKSVSCGASCKPKLTAEERKALLDKLEQDLRKKFGDKVIIRRGSYQ